MKNYLFKAFKYLKWSDIGHLFLAFIVFPFAIIAKIFIRNYWLVTETRYEARDTGYWFFKWVRENKPKQKIAYAIDKHSPDYAKVKPLGKVIGRNNFSHWFWYIVADKNISSQKHGKPNAVVCYLFEVVFGLRKNNRVFLQHGVTKDKLDWLFYENTKYRLFMTSAKPEYEYVANNYHYPDGYVRMCCLTRFDGLHNFEVDNDLILVIPTWREWLGRESRENKDLDFEKTDYCIKWNEFLNSPEIDALLQAHNKRILFYPHRNMQKFLKYFSTDSKNIEIADWHNYDIQDVLKRAALMITDYSSVFFDFAYMRKPVIFYQFDEAEFRAKQYAEGYFDYHNTVLGQWAGDLASVAELLGESIENNFAKQSEETVREFFPLWDDKNSERTYDAIIGLRKKHGKKEKIHGRG